MRTMRVVDTPWLVVLSPKPAPRLRLFCFPYAGGGASTFLPWVRLLPADVEVCAVQLPGREERLSETPMTDWRAVIDQVMPAITSRLDRPYALFGHSVGAVLAFELARRLQREARPGLEHLHVAGHQAPHLPPVDPPIGDLPDREFTQRLKDYAGTPDEILQNAELLDLFIPILRADFRLCETYDYRPETPLTVPISAYGGLADPHAPIAGMEAWREQTTGPFRQVMFPGGHFFLHDCRQALLCSIAPPR